MYNQNSDLMKQEKFMLPTMIEGDFSAEELAEDADGLQMSFQRVKIPAGGTLQFEMPSDDPDNPDYEKNLVGVILHNHATCAYWPAGSEYDDDTTPLCSSVDGKVGIGTPGGACAACVMNRFGSAPDGSKGKACKNMRVLYLLRSGEYMPLQVNLPPTSIKPFKEFLNRAFMLRRRATYGSIVQIGLKRENNGPMTTVLLPSNCCRISRARSWLRSGLTPTVLRSRSNSCSSSVPRSLRSSATPAAIM